MKKQLFLVFLICVSCQNERLVELPEITQAEISEVLDVSPAYIFYDEREKDSVLFNRKNIIGTTNWLVNVDKRLSLRQALPHLQYLQNKRQKKGMHTNENARNYFTCHDLSKGTLGFLDFTETNFVTEDVPQTKTDESNLKLEIYHPKKIGVITANKPSQIIAVSELEDTLRKFVKTFSVEQELVLVFDKNLSFQDYITIKESVSVAIQNTPVKISNEFFLNMNLLN
jgi:hypothetical protein